MPVNTLVVGGHGIVDGSTEESEAVASRATFASLCSEREVTRVEEVAMAFAIQANSRA